MKTKTSSQMTDLESAMQLLKMAAQYLYHAEEPGLQLAVNAARNRVDLTLSSLKQNPAALK